MESKLEKLLEARAAINKEINAFVLAQYEKHESNKELVVDDNPFSRLYALKKMGVVPNYEEITKKTVIIVGVGGVGSVVAEMLTRCGVGKLILYDYDRVELANMNRLFYTPNQVGLSKVEAAKETLSSINPKVIIETFNANITTTDNFKILLKNIQTGGQQDDRVDLVLSCVDNYAARMTINTACNELDQVWFESGVSEDALSAHIQAMFPGETACFSCLPPLALVEQSEANIKREGVCAASLPTTMGITAGFLSHTTLKFLLEFEEITSYLQYNARTEFFTNSMMTPNPECTDKNCVKRQEERRKGERESRLALRKAAIQAKKEKKEEKKEPSPNEWGIEIIEESQEQPEKKEEVKVAVVPSKKVEDAKEVQVQESLEDLMSQLNDLQKET